MMAIYYEKTVICVQKFISRDCQIELVKYGYEKLTLYSLLLFSGEDIFSIVF